MKKLSLDALKVESFDTAAAPEERGTVHAHTEYDWMCTAPVSCDYGCNTRHEGTCFTGLTCNGCARPTYYMDTCPPECYD